MVLTRYATPAEVRAPGGRRCSPTWRAPAGCPARGLERACAAAAGWRSPAGRARGPLVRELATEALACRARLARLDRALEAALARHPDAALIRSLPGMGAVLTAELIAEAGTLARFRSADALAAAAGLAPVLRQSGKVRFLRRPAGGNKS